MPEMVTSSPLTFMAVPTPKPTSVAEAAPGTAGSPGSPIRLNESRIRRYSRYSPSATRTLAPVAAMSMPSWISAPLSLPLPLVPLSTKTSPTEPPTSLDSRSALNSARRAKMSRSSEPVSISASTSTMSAISVTSPSAPLPPLLSVSISAPTVISPLAAILTLPFRVLRISAVVVMSPLLVRTVTLPRSVSMPARMMSPRASLAVPASIRTLARREDELSRVRKLIEPASSATSKAPVQTSAGQKVSPVRSMPPLPSTVALRVRSVRLRLLRSKMVVSLPPPSAEMLRRASMTILASVCSISLW